VKLGNFYLMGKKTIKENRPFRSKNEKIIFEELKTIIYKYCRGTHKGFRKKQERVAWVTFLLGKLSSKELSNEVVVKNKINGQNKFHLLDLFCCYVLAKKNDAEEEVIEIFYLVFAACDFDTRLIDFRYVKKFYIKHLSTMKAMGFGFKNELSVQDVKTLEKYQRVIKEKIAGSKSRTIKQFRKLEKLYKDMCKDQNRLFGCWSKFILMFLENFEIDFITKIDSNCEQILKNIKRDHRKSRKVKPRKNRNVKFNDRRTKLLLRAIKRYKICALDEVYSGFEFDSKIGELWKGLFKFGHSLIWESKEPIFVEKYKILHPVLKLISTVNIRIDILMNKIGDDFKKYNSRWKECIDLMGSTYLELSNKLLEAYLKTSVGKKVAKDFQSDRQELVELWTSLNSGNSGKSDSSPTTDITTKYLEEHLHEIERGILGKKSFKKRVVKKYLIKFSELFAKREKKYRDYVTGKKKIKAEKLEKFKKRQNQKRLEEKKERERLATKKETKRNVIRSIFQKKIDKKENSRDMFNTKFKILSRLMSDFSAKLNNLNSGVFSFDIDTDRYYDFYDDFLYKRVFTCYAKYNLVLKGYGFGKETESLVRLKGFMNDMEIWKKREDKLKHLYENPFGINKKKTKETFRNKVLNIVKKNEFAKALFNWTCRLKKSGKDYFYKGFTWGATYFEATTGNRLSQSTHYLKCRDIIYSIKEYLRYEGDDVSAMDRLVLLKELKMCERARECFYKEYPDEADAMDYWWEGNPYVIDFKG